MFWAYRRLFGVRLFLLFSAVVGLFLVVPQPTEAGFGITPPYVENFRLTRGTVYQQKITLVRSDPVEDLEATITLNVPGIEHWFSIDRGEKFILPKGTTQLPIVVTVTVPEDADYKKHEGAIRIRTASVGDPAEGSVSIALGAQVDVDLEVVDQILDFDVRQIKISDLEEGRRRWGLHFPAKIRFFMTVENTGNTRFGPTRVQFDIFDSNEETLLETTENTNRIEQIEPFVIKEVQAELPTKLPPGRYTAKYTIYKGEEIAQQNTVTMSVATLGAVPGYSGYSFDGLTLSDQLKIGAVLLVPIVLIVVLIVVLATRRRRHPREDYHDPYSG